MRCLAAGEQKNAVAPKSAKVNCHLARSKRAREDVACSPREKTGEPESQARQRVLCTSRRTPRNKDAAEGKGNKSKLNTLSKKATRATQAAGGLPSEKEIAAKLAATKPPPTPQAKWGAGCKVSKRHGGEVQRVGAADAREGGESGSLREGKERARSG